MSSGVNHLESGEMDDPGVQQQSHRRACSSTAVVACAPVNINITGLYICQQLRLDSQLGLYGPFLYRLTTHPMAKAAFPSVFSVSSASTFLPPTWTRTMGTCKAAYPDQPHRSVCWIITEGSQIRAGLEDVIGGIWGGR